MMIVFAKNGSETDYEKSEKSKRKAEKHFVDSCRS